VPPLRQACGAGLKARDGEGAYVLLAKVYTRRQVLPLVCKARCGATGKGEGGSMTYANTLLAWIEARAMKDTARMACRAPVASRADARAARIARSVCDGDFPPPASSWADLGI